MTPVFDPDAPRGRDPEFWERINEKNGVPIVRDLSFEFQLTLTATPGESVNRVFKFHFPVCDAILPSPTTVTSLQAMEHELASQVERLVHEMAQRLKKPTGLAALRASVDKGGMI